MKLARFIPTKIIVTTQQLVHQFVDELFLFYGLLMDMAFLASLYRIQRGHDVIWIVIERLIILARFIPTKTTVTTQ